MQFNHFTNQNPEYSRRSYYGDMAYSDMDNSFGYSENFDHQRNSHIQGKYGRGAYTSISDHETPDVPYRELRPPSSHFPAQYETYIPIGNDHTHNDQPPPQSLPPSRGRSSRSYSHSHIYNLPSSHQGGMPTISATSAIPSSYPYHGNSNGLNSDYASSINTNTTTTNNNGNNNNTNSNNNNYNPDLLIHSHASTNPYYNPVTNTSNSYGFHHHAQPNFDSDYSPYSTSNHSYYPHSYNGNHSNIGSYTTHHTSTISTHTESSDAHSHGYRIHPWTKASMMGSSNDMTDHEYGFGVIGRGMVDTSLPSTPREVITGGVERGEGGSDNGDGNSNEGREREGGGKIVGFDRRRGLEGESGDTFDMIAIDNKMYPQSHSQSHSYHSNYQYQYQYQYQQQQQQQPHHSSTFIPVSTQLPQYHQDMEDNNFYSPYPLASSQSHHRPFVYHSDFHERDERDERDERESNLTTDHPSGLDDLHPTQLQYSETLSSMTGIETVNRNENRYPEAINQRPLSAHIDIRRVDEERSYHPPSSSHATLSSHTPILHKPLATTNTTTRITTRDDMMEKAAVRNIIPVDTDNDITNKNRNTTECSFPNAERRELRYSTRVWTMGEDERRTPRLDLTRPYSSSASFSTSIHQRHEQNSYGQMYDGHEEEMDIRMKNGGQPGGVSCSPTLQRYHSHFPRDSDTHQQQHQSYTNHYSDHYHYHHEQQHEQQHEQHEQHEQYQRISEDSPHAFFSLCDSFSPPPPPPPQHHQQQHQHQSLIPSFEANQYSEVFPPSSLSVPHSIPMNSHISSMSTEVVLSIDELERNKQQHGEEYDHEQEKDKEYEFDYGNEHEHEHEHHYDNPIDNITNNDDGDNHSSPNTNQTSQQDKKSSLKSKDTSLLLTCSSPHLTNLCSLSSTTSIHATCSSPPQIPQPSSPLLSPLPSDQSLQQHFSQRSHYPFELHTSTDNAMTRSTMHSNHHSQMNPQHQQHQQDTEDIAQPMFSPTSEYTHFSTKSSMNNPTSPLFPESSQVFPSQPLPPSHPPYNSSSLSHPSNYYLQNTHSAHTPMSLPPLRSSSPSSHAISVIPSDSMNMVTPAENPISMNSHSRPTSGHSFTHSGTMYSRSHYGHYQARPHPEVSTTSISYSQASNSSSSSSLLSILLQSSLWKHPLYADLYQSLFTSSKLQQKPLTEAQLKSRVDEGMMDKKQGKIITARKLFLELVFSNASSSSVWVDFARFEMECGEYDMARSLLDLADQIHPLDESLLQRRIKVEEKLHSLQGLLYVVSGLNQSESQKALKMYSEAVLAIMRIGYEQVAFELFQQSFNQQKHVSGNFYLDYLNYEIQVTSPSHCLQFIPSALERFPRFGPLWFTCLDLIENSHQLQWDCRDIVARVMCPFFFDMMEKALQSLTQDILWKALLSRLQFWVRSIMDIRSVPIHEVSYEVFIQIMHALYSFITQDAYRAVSVCAKNLRWRFYLLLSRMACLLGWKRDAFKIIRHGIKLAPPKSTSVVDIEFARCAFIAGQQHEALLVLRSACLRFPDEWKTDLELLQQLILNEQYYTALITNQYSLKRHNGAGRLWSTYIYLIHLLFGPQPAYLIFKQALCHVAKSGEVWCEGVRLFLNPIFSRFSLQRAAKALNFAIFFTPQYGDSYIEGLHLYLLLSDSFLRFHSCPSVQQLTMLLVSQPSLFSFINRCSYCEPNYGPMWFSMKENVLSTAKEVLLHSAYKIALQIAQHSELYYEAICRSAEQKKNGMSDQTNVSLFGRMISVKYLDGDKWQLKRKVIYGSNQVDC